MVGLGVVGPLSGPPAASPQEAKPPAVKPPAAAIANAPAAGIGGDPELRRIKEEYLKLGGRRSQSWAVPLEVTADVYEYLAGKRAVSAQEKEQAAAARTQVPLLQQRSKVLKIVQEIAQDPGKQMPLQWKNLKEETKLEIAAEKKSAKSKLDNLEKDVERYKSLYKTGAGSYEEWWDVYVRYKQAGTRYRELEELDLLYDDFFEFGFLPFPELLSGGAASPLVLDKRGQLPPQKRAEILSSIRRHLIRVLDEESRYFEPRVEMNRQKYKTRVELRKVNASSELEVERARLDLRRSEMVFKVMQRVFKAQERMLKVQEMTVAVSAASAVGQVGGGWAAGGGIVPTVPALAPLASDLGVPLAVQRAVERETLAQVVALAEFADAQADFAKFEAALYEGLKKTRAVSGLEVELKKIDARLAAVQARAAAAHRDQVVLLRKLGYGWSSIETILGESVFAQFGVSLSRDLQREGTAPEMAVVDASALSRITRFLSPELEGLDPKDVPKDVKGMISGVVELEARKKQLQVEGLDLQAQRVRVIAESYKGVAGTYDPLFIESIRVFGMGEAVLKDQAGMAQAELLLVRRPERYADARRQYEQAMLDARKAQGERIQASLAVERKKLNSGWTRTRLDRMMREALIQELDLDQKGLELEMKWYDALKNPKRALPLVAIAGDVEPPTLQLLERSRHVVPYQPGYIEMPDGSLLLLSRGERDEQVRTPFFNGRGGLSWDGSYVRNRETGLDVPRERAVEHVCEVGTGDLRTLGIVTNGFVFGFQRGGGHAIVIDQGPLLNARPRFKDDWDYSQLNEEGEPTHGWVLLPTHRLSIAGGRVERSGLGFTRQRWSRERIEQIPRMLAEAQNPILAPQEFAPDGLPIYGKLIPTGAQIKIRVRGGTEIYAVAERKKMNEQGQEVSEMDLELTEFIPDTLPPPPEGDIGPGAGGRRPAHPAGAQEAADQQMAAEQAARRSRWLWGLAGGGALTAGAAAWLAYRLGKKERPQAGLEEREDATAGQGAAMNRRQFLWAGAAAAGVVTGASLFELGGAAGDAPPAVPSMELDAAATKKIRELQAALSNVKAEQTIPRMEFLRWKAERRKELAKQKAAGLTDLEESLTAVQQEPALSAQRQLQELLQAYLKVGEPAAKAGEDFERVGRQLAAAEKHLKEQVDFLDRMASRYLKLREQGACSQEELDLILAARRKAETLPASQAELRGLYDDLARLGAYLPLPPAEGVAQRAEVGGAVPPLLPKKSELTVRQKKERISSVRQRIIRLLEWEKKRLQVDVDVRGPIYEVRADLFRRGAASEWERAESQLLYDQIPVLQAQQRVLTAQQELLRVQDEWARIPDQGTAALQAGKMAAALSSRNVADLYSAVLDPKERAIAAAQWAVDQAALGLTRAQIGLAHQEVRSRQKVYDAIWNGEFASMNEKQAAKAEFRRAKIKQRLLQLQVELDGHLRWFGLPAAIVDFSAPFALFSSEPPVYPQLNAKSDTYGETNFNWKPGGKLSPEPPRAGVRKIILNPDPTRYLVEEAGDAGRISGPLDLHIAMQALIRPSGFLRDARGLIQPVLLGRRDRPTDAEIRHHASEVERILGELADGRMDQLRVEIDLLDRELPVYEKLYRAGAATLDELQAARDKSRRAQAMRKQIDFIRAQKALDQAADSDQFKVLVKRYEEALLAWLKVDQTQVSLWRQEWERRLKTIEELLEKGASSEEEVRFRRSEAELMRLHEKEMNILVELAEFEFRKMPLVDYQRPTGSAAASASPENLQRVPQQQPPQVRYVTVRGEQGVKEMAMGGEQWTWLAGPPRLADVYRWKQNVRFVSIPIGQPGYPGYWMSEILTPLYADVGAEIGPETPGSVNQLVYVYLSGPQGYQLRSRKYLTVRPGLVVNPRPRFEQDDRSERDKEGEPMHGWVLLPSYRLSVVGGRAELKGLGFIRQRWPKERIARIPQMLAQEQGPVLEPQGVMPDGRPIPEELIPIGQRIKIRVEEGGVSGWNVYEVVERKELDEQQGRQVPVVDLRLVEFIPGEVQVSQPGEVEFEEPAGKQAAADQTEQATQRSRLLWWLAGGGALTAGAAGWLAYRLGKKERPQAGLEEDKLAEVIGILSNPATETTLPLLAEPGMVTPLEHYFPGIGEKIRAAGFERGEAYLAPVGTPASLEDKAFHVYVTGARAGIVKEGLAPAGEAIEFVDDINQANLVVADSAFDPAVRQSYLARKAGAFLQVDREDVARKITPEFLASLASEGFLQPGSFLMLNSLTIDQQSILIFA